MIQVTLGPRVEVIRKSGPPRLLGLIFEVVDPVKLPRSQAPGSVDRIKCKVGKPILQCHMLLLHNAGRKRKPLPLAQAAAWSHLDWEAKSHHLIGKLASTNGTGTVGTQNVRYTLYTCEGSNSSTVALCLRYPKRSKEQALPRVEKAFCAHFSDMGKLQVA